MMPIGMSTSTGSNDRFERQRGLVPTQTVRGQSVTVIGVGAIGRQLALQLAAFGVGKIQLIDFDQVENHNVTSQGYLYNDIGIAKVDAVSRFVGEIDPDIVVSCVNDRFRPTQCLSPVVFCCVDSISGRAAIWNSISRQVRFWADGRMLGEIIRVLVACDERSAKHYRSTLFAQSEAQTGSCTSRSTIYAASIAAGLMVHQYSRWLRELLVDTDSQMNLLAGEFSTRN